MAVFRQAVFAPGGLEDARIGSERGLPGVNGRGALGAVVEKHRLTLGVRTEPRDQSLCTRTHGGVGL